LSGIVRANVTATMKSNYYTQYEEGEFSIASAAKKSRNWLIRKS